MSYETPAGAPAAPPIILASTSRYRGELLARLKLPFSTRSPNAPEDAIDGEAPEAMAARLALAKARSIVVPNALVIGADQVASLDGNLLRKPGTAEVAIAQLRACQGKTVLFHTAVSVIATSTGTTLQHTDRTEVLFRRLGDRALARYVSLESPLDCAGSFKSEGLGVALFERISSHDPTALVGLPLIFVAAALRELGADPLRATSS